MESRAGKVSSPIWRHRRAAFVVACVLAVVPLTGCSDDGDGLQAVGGAGGAINAPGAGGSTTSTGGAPGGMRKIFETCTCDSMSPGLCSLDVQCEVGDLLRGGRPAPLTCFRGLCRPECYTESDCPANSFCEDYDYVNGADFAPIATCTDPCTPLPDTCPSGTSCAYVGNTAIGPILDCQPRPAAATPPCATDSDCPVGKLCVGDSGDMACDPWCRVGQAADCPASAVCVGLDPALVLGGVTFGACRAKCDPTKTCADGSRCVIESQGGQDFTDCLPANAVTLADSSPCRFQTDCPAGQTCRVHDMVNASCEPYCTLPSGACPSGSTCRPLPTSPTVEGVTYGTCMTNCDLASTSSCGSNACVLVTDVPGGAATDCAPPSAGAGPFGCQPGTGCVAGSRCTSFAVPNLSACEPWCRVGQGDCPASSTCAAIVPALVLGSVTYGVCQETCDLTSPTTVCGVDATCLAIVDGTNPPHTACAGVPPFCTTMNDADCNPVTTCTPSESFPLGASCQDDTGCPPGSTCASGFCLAWCVVGASGGCPVGTSCIAETPPLMLGGMSYGTCH
jgi:hypothetical protein